MFPIYRSEIKNLILLREKTNGNDITEVKLRALSVVY
jgi:hypothetical protein